MKKLLIEITSTLISFPTVTPQANEKLCEPYITKLFTQAGMKVSKIAKDISRPNIIGEIGRGEKTLVVACHMDVVPAGTGWNTDPFKAVVKGDKLYGRGAIDDKGPFAISYCAIKEFVSNFPKFNGKIYLVALADEENDNEFGVKYLLSSGFRADGGLIPDGGYFSRVDIGEKGCLQIVIESHGKQAHSALDETGDNAITNLANLVNKLTIVPWPSNYNKLFTPTKLNISRFQGGEYANTVPPHAWIQMDIRYPMGIGSQQILDILKSNLKKTRGTFTFKVLYKTEPHLVQDTKIIDSFLKAAQSLSIPMKTITLAGNSVAKEFNQAGIPSIVHYPMEELHIHEPNEYISISAMKKTVTLYNRFFEEYFQVF